MTDHVVSEVTPGPVTSVDVRFTNDSCSACGGNPVGGGDRNLFVNSITIGSTVIQPTDSSISYTAAPCNETVNNIGYMLCTGDMISTNPPVSGSVDTITVKAYGQSDYSIYPHMQVFVNGVLMGEFDVTGTAATYNVPAHLNRGEIYAGGSHIATYVNGTTYFDHVDWTGTERARTGMTGAVCETMTNVPFGDWLAMNGPCADASPSHFTGKQRDPETASIQGGTDGLDYFGARYNNSRIGRWMTPDPGVPNDLKPQTFNKYSYASNNPVSSVDPDGRFATHYHVTWGIVGLGSLGFGEQDTFVTEANDFIDINHFFDNNLHSMSGPTAYALTRQFLLDKATDSSFPSNASAALVALVMGMHLVQDSISHAGITSLAQHFLKYPGGDDISPQDMNAAVDATTAFLNDFQDRLTKRLGDDGGAQEALARMCAATDISADAVKKYIDDLSSSIAGMLLNYNDFVMSANALSPGEPTGVQQDEFSPLENLDNSASCQFNGGGACY